MKHFLKVAIFISVSPFAYATYAQDTAFGIKAGINLSNIDLEDSEATYNSRTGYHAGVFLRGKFDKIAIQPELLLYTQKGEIERSVFGTAEESLTYVTVPVMLKFYPVLGLNIQLGPQFGFLVDGERKYSNPAFTASEDITDYYKGSDVSVALGLGYDFDFGLGIDARYNIGVKDINDEVDGDPAKSRIFMISLGWNFVGGD